MVISLVTINSEAIVHAESGTLDASNDFYNYWLRGDEYYWKNDTYRVSLTDSFKNELNKGSDGSFTGKDAEGNTITWKTGDPLPNPAPNGEYNGKKITCMAFLFEECENITSLDLSSFDTSNVEDMSKMFDHCDNLQSLNLSSFDTSNVGCRLYDEYV